MPKDIEALAAEVVLNPVAALIARILELHGPEGSLEPQEALESTRVRELLNEKEGRYGFTLSDEKQVTAALHFLQREGLVPKENPYKLTSDGRKVVARVWAPFFSLWEGPK